MTDAITYRKALVEDAVKLSVLYKQVYIQTYGTDGVSDEFANFITQQFAIERIKNTVLQNPDAIWVAVYRNNLVGVCETEFDKKSHVGEIIAPELNKLYILEWFCGRGIGEKLLAMAEATAREKGQTQMWLWVLESNARAIGFYKKHGYREIGKASFQMETNRYENKVMLKNL